MTPGGIAKWRVVELKERSASQSHFNDLCRLLGEPTPTDADPAGEWYCFERGARKDIGGDGWTDVWKRGCFGQKILRAIIGGERDAQRLASFRYRQVKASSETIAASL